MNCSITQTEFVQQPADVGIYEMDFAAKFLAGTGDTAGNLLAFEYTVNPDGFTATSPIGVGQPVPGGIVMVRAEGCAPGKEYVVSARISTTQGREKTWAITLLGRNL